MTLLRIALVPVVLQGDGDRSVCCCGVGEITIAQNAVHQCRISVVVAEEAALEIAAAVRLEMIDVDDSVVGSGNAAGAFAIGSACGFVGAVLGSVIQLAGYRSGDWTGGLFVIAAARGQQHGYTAEC